MNKEIDQIVEAFIVEMARITALDESDSQKERHAKTWLRTTLAAFEQKILQNRNQTTATKK